MAFKLGEATRLDKPAVASDAGAMVFTRRRGKNIPPQPVMVTPLNSLHQPFSNHSIETREIMNWVAKLQQLAVTPLEGDQFSPLSEDELEQLENRIGHPFPADYRSFLGQFGACDFEEYAVIPTEGGGIAPGSFFGGDLADALIDFRERLPELVLAINDDGAGNLICISLRADSFGAIFFQSHTSGSDDSLGDADAAKFATLFRIAPDFGSFLLELKTV